MRRIRVRLFLLVVSFGLVGGSPQDQANLYNPSYIDHSISPCDNFYRFALGTWLGQAPQLIRPDQSTLGYDSDLLERQEKVLREILGGPRPVPSREGRLVRAFYQSVLHGPRGEGLAAIRPLLDRIQKAQDPKGCARMIGELHRAGIGALWEWSVEPGHRDPGRTWFGLPRAWTGLPGRAYYTADDSDGRSIRAAYREHLAKILGLAGYSPREAATYAEATLAFDVDLAKQSLEPLKQGEAYKNATLRSVAEMEERIPGFPWAAYAQGLGLSNKPQILVVDEGAVAHAVQWLAQAPTLVREAYFTLCVLKTLGPYLPKAFAEAHRDFWETRMQGKTSPPQPDQEALNVTRKFLGMPLGREYLRRTLQKGTDTRVQQMMANLRRALITQWEGCTWLSPEVRRSAAEKANAMQVVVAQPRNWPSLNGLRIEARRTLAQNVLAVRSHQARLKLAGAGHRTNPDIWPDNITPLSPTAFADPPRCRIVVPAGIIQPPYFDLRASDASNYGGLGCVMGHEIGHLFDEMGRHYDALGRLAKDWSPEDERAYRGEANKLASQINAYEVLPGYHSDGALTLSEAMADLAGVRISFEAFRLTHGTRAASKDPHGFTPEQVFFLTYAESYRYWQRDEALKDSLKWEVHSTPEFSVNGPLANLGGFHKVFGCTDGSRMFALPDTRPRIWKAQEAPKPGGNPAR